MKIQSIYLTLLLPVALCSLAKAQFVWYEGEATLATGITVRGELCYQPHADALLLRQSGKIRTYSVDQLRRFHYTDEAVNVLRFFATYDVLQPAGETRAILLEELIPGAVVPLLRLSAPHTARWAAGQGLPQNRSANWATPQPWYVYLDGRLVALDAFVETELDGLVASAPKAAQQWAAKYARPANPKALARWLVYINGKLMSVPDAQPKVSPTITAQLLEY